MLIGILVGAVGAVGVILLGLGFYAVVRWLANLSNINID